MLIAVQSGLFPVAIGLFLVLLFISKGKLLIFALVLAGVLFLAVSGGSVDPMILGGLVLAIFLLIVKKDSDEPQTPSGFYGGGMQ